VAEAVDTAALARRLREADDRREIASLIHRYCLHFDANEPERVAALFAADAIVDYGPEFAPVRGGPAEIEAAIAPGLRDRFAATSHHVSNVEIELEGDDAARSVSTLYAWHRYVEDVPESELWGRYRHTFRRTAAGWRITTLRLEAAGSRDFHRSRMHPIGRRPA
jgi:ketosteroid isomerase-like protein